jgi:2-polyprenyl-3-methyl-5-hydroxy-6-metoxy-1,4-benzoquinol methylase
MNNKNVLRKKLAEIVSQYPEDLAKSHIKNIDRMAFNIGLVLDRKGSDVKICDMGGGYSLFAVGCAAMGMKSVLIDDFKDPVVGQTDSPLELFRSYGVEIISMDGVQEALPFEPGSIDVFTMFEAIEHFHHSPKSLLHQMKATLSDDGLLILSAPNSVNIRKRLAVPLGYSNWSSMGSWYELEVFRGHVREPTVSDLKYIAHDLGLRDIEVLGLNWMGLRNSRAIVRIMAKLIDPVLRLKPSLCSNLYLIGRT